LVALPSLRERKARLLYDYDDLPFVRRGAIGCMTGGSGWRGDAGQGG
jgi:hypothetical protein